MGESLGESLFTLLTGMRDWQKYSQFTWNTLGVESMINHCETLVDELHLSPEQIEQVRQRINREWRTRREIEDMEDSKNG
jgi:hypothetical protein